ncbi:hypothetical protein O23A_p0656 [Aeromonas salmonicida]|nr:hypothetical protein O23A_p0656 [Aeromonas salmonicida]
MFIISKCDTRPNKHIIFKCYSIPDINPRFYCNTITNDDIIFD